MVGLSDVIKTCVVRFTNYLNIYRFHIGITKYSSFRKIEIWKMLALLMCTTLIKLLPFSIYGTLTYLFIHEYIS